MAPFTISISGPDDIGRATLLKLIPKSWKFDLAKPLHHFQSKLGVLTESTREARDAWWFPSSQSTTNFDGSDVDIVQTLYRACQNRHNSVSTGLFDRSGIMIEALSAARVATAGALSLEGAQLRVRTILSGFDFPHETTSIFLRRSGSLSEAIQSGIRLEEKRIGKPPGAAFAQFQEHLQEALEHQIEAGRYDVVLDVPHDEPIISTLHRVVEAIRERLPGPDSLDPSHFPHLLSTVRCVVALGGLSESGKSTTATSLVSRHNLNSAQALSTLELGRSGGAFRFKVAYLEHIASPCLGKSVYALAPKERALQVISRIG